MINPISHIKFNKSFCIILVVSLVSFCVYGKDNSLIYTNINTNSTAFFNNSLSYKNSFDWKKHKSYKIYAWTSLSVGGAMMVIGVIRKSN